MRPRCRSATGRSRRPPSAATCSRATPAGNPPWINAAAGTFDLDAKVVVDGAVSWPGQFSAEVHGKKLLLTGNALPTKQTTGVFPVVPGDDAFLYDPNPNSIAAQSLSYELRANPNKASQRSCLPFGAIGVARNGVEIFNALDAANRDAVAHEVQDSCEGHPQQQSLYHYHSIPGCLTDGESKHKHSKLVGYALDGFPIYGPRGEDGKLLDDDDLDRCHGETGKVKLRGEKIRIYHYHATLEYPYTLGCFRGTPVATGAP
jgi:hypothetical protein